MAPSSGGHGAVAQLDDTGRGMSGNIRHPEGCLWKNNNNLLSCSVLISENEKSIQSVECKDKLSAKKCKKLKKKGKCEDKKSWKKCMETCQKCTPGTSDCN